MTIAPASALRPLAPSAPGRGASASLSGLTDTFTASRGRAADAGRLALGSLAGAGLGVYAGLATGGWAGLAGMAAGLSGGAALGVLGSAFVAEKLLGTEGANTAGWVIAGGLGGGIAGLLVGGYVGFQISHPLAAVGMGLLGGAGGFLYSALQG